MSYVQSSVSIAANATNENVLDGFQAEFAARDALAEFGLVASATGLELDIYSGSDLVAESFEPSIQNRYPVYPDDFPLQDVVAAGERLKIRARNTTGGALTLFFAVRQTPLG